MNEKTLRNCSPRDRNLKKEQSFSNPNFLQLNVCIAAVKNYFERLSPDKKVIYDFGCGQKPYVSF